MFNLPKTSGRNFCRFSANSVAAFILAVVFYQTADSQAAGADFAAPIKICGFFQSEQVTETVTASDNDKTLYATFSDGKILSLDPQSLKKVWATELGGVIVSNALVDLENLYVIGRYSPIPIKNEENENTNRNGGSRLIVRVLGRSTGVTRWQVEVASPEFSPPEKAYLYEFGNHLLIVGDAGEICLLAKADGRVVWRKSLSVVLTAPPLLENGRIVLGTIERRILSFSIDDGRLLGDFEISAPPTVIVWDAESDNLIVGDRRGSITFVNEKRRVQSRRFRSGAEISSINITAEGFLVSSLDNFIYLLANGKSGELIWKKRLAGRISAAPLIHKNYLVVASTESPEVGVFELKSGKTANRLTLDEGNFFTGKSLQTGNLFFYTTARGIISFMIGENICSSSKSAPPD